jgi:hypothetical protein
MVVVKKLQNSSGALRADAERTLRAGAVLSDEMTTEAADRFRELYAEFIPAADGKAEKILPTSFDAIQLELLWNFDPIPILEKWVGTWGREVTLVRLVTTEALHLRDLFWRLAEAHLTEGVTFQEMINQRRWPALGQISSTIVVHAGTWAVAPMTARVQPLAAAFTTARGAEIVAIPKGAWNRDPYQPLLWPSGFGGLRMSGSGADAYAREGDGTIPHTVAGEMFQHQVDGLDGLLRRLTDPGLWTTTSGELDHQERAIAWSTVNLGMSAIRAIGKLWGEDESVWTAFRAFGILAGYWTPVGGQDVTTAQLVTPTLVDEYAASRIQPTWLSEWSRNTINNWSTVLTEMFPNADADYAIGAVQELRNLVHGVGVGKPKERRPRGARLLALAATGKANLQLVRDLAVMWWTAFLQNPKTHAQHAKPPFE